MLPTDPAEMARVLEAATQPAATAGRLTVFQVIPRLEAGGAELGALQVATRLVSLGHRAVIASEGGRMVPAFEAAGARHVVMPLASKNPLTMVANARRLAALVHETGADLIHARSRAPAWSALRAARRLGVPFVTTYHSDYGARGAAKRLYNSVMARGDAVIAVSQAIADSIVRQYPWAAPQVEVVHRGVDPVRFDPEIDPSRVAAMREAWHAAPGEPVVLLAARLSPRKGHAVAIRAMRQALQAGVPPFWLVFAGDDHQGKSEYRQAMAALAAELGLAERVLFTGHVSDMPAAYAAAALSLNVSSAEGFARVALESQAMATPVIVADHGPGLEVILSEPGVSPDATTGLAVPFDAPDRLAAAIGTFFAMTHDARAAMGRRGSQRVRGTFTIDRLTARTLAIYKAVMTSGVPPRPPRSVPGPRAATGGGHRP